MLNYLVQFEEALFRRIELDPDYLAERLLPFCQGSKFAELKGLALPPGRAGISNVYAGGLDALPPSAPETADTSARDGTFDSEGRPFWVAPLVAELGSVPRDDVRRHLLGVE